MRCLVLLFTLLAIPAAGQTAPRPVVPTPCRTPPVPATAPDSVPLSIFERMAHDTPFMSGRFPRDVVFIEFFPGTTVEQRQAAVDAVCGTVVGGYPRIDTYAVRIADHPQAAVLFGAIGVLRRMPGVWGADPGLLLGID
jgi:hypothetical protein